MAKGKVSRRIMGFAQDITQRKRTEQRLRETAERYELAVRGTHDGIWDWNIQTGEVYYSPRWQEILGYQENDLAPTAEAFNEQLHPDDRARTWAAVEAHLGRGTPYDLEYRLQHKNGHYVWVRARGQAQWSKSGEPLRMAGSISDITARKETEQALRESEARMRAFLDANPDMIFRIDREGRYLDFHAPDHSLLVAAPDDLVGRKASDFFDPGFVRASQEYIEKALDTGETLVWEYQLPIDGVEREFEARFVRAQEHEVIVTIRDITERVELEREVIAIGENERNRIGRDLHDGLGQTLTGISLGLKALSQKLADEGSPHVDAMQSLTLMVQRSIVETRRAARLLSPGVSVESGLSEALSVLAQEVNEYSNVVCRAHCGDENTSHNEEVTMHLYRIAQEAVTNALKHGNPQNIELRYGCDGDHIRLEVLDDGIGLPPERDRIDGVGLKSMRYRARVIHGQLEVAPRPEGGTKVLCSCPC